MKDGYLLWLDLETTGLDPMNDLPLEIGLTITDMDLNAVDAEGGWPEFQTLIAWPRIAEFVMEDVVIEMHTRNGLLLEIMDGKGLTIPQVAKHIIELLGSIGKPGDFVLAGSGVSHFDRPMLDNYMPEVTDWLRYYNMDIGDVRRFLHDVVDLPDDLFAPASDQETKTHRAMEDVIQHLTEARHYKNLLRSLDDSPRNWMGGGLEISYVEDDPENE